MRAMLEGNRVSRISVRGFAVASATAVTTVGAVVGVASGDTQSSKSNDLEATASDATLLADIPAGQHAQVQTTSVAQQADAQAMAADTAAKKSAAEAARKQAAKDAVAKQQAAEKAVKALHLHLHQEAWGHVVARLIEELPSATVIPEGLVDKARVLDLLASLRRDLHRFAELGAEYAERASAEGFAAARRWIAP